MLGFVHAESVPIRVSQSHTIRVSFVELLVRMSYFNFEDFSSNFRLVMMRMKDRFFYVFMMVRWKKRISQEKHLCIYLKWQRTNHVTHIYFEEILFHITNFTNWMKCVRRRNNKSTSICLENFIALFSCLLLDHFNLFPNTLIACTLFLVVSLLFKCEVRSSTMHLVNEIIA